MPDLLLLGCDSQSALEIEELAKRLGFRTKCVFNFKLALDWLKTKPFDAVCLPAAVSVDHQLTLANTLWRSNPLAPLILYSLDADTEHVRRRARLFGADVASGPEALKVLEKILQKVKPHGSMKSENFRILVVEDLDSARDIICAYIEGLGFPSVKGVESAAEALAVLNQDPKFFSCVLTDIRMPRMSGQELIRAVRADSKVQHLPMVVLTAYGTVDCLIECLKAGASGFLVKPPKKEDIMREISRAFRMFSSGGSPRLVEEQEAEMLKELLIERGAGP